MATFNPISGSYVGNGMAYDNLTTSADFMRSHPAYSYHEPMPVYQGNDLHYTAPAVVPRQTYYDDPYADSVHDRSSPETPSIERGNRLLSFQSSIGLHTVLDYAMRPLSTSMQAQLHGMFFLAESARTGTGEFTSSPPELTCYRRNLFQISGSVTLPRMLQYVVTEHGERHQVVSTELGVTASESVEGTSVKLISVPWKTQVNGSAPTPEDKTEKEPSAIQLDQSTTHDLDSDYSIYPIAWKRLQFRVATANNGRRKELQQHFVLKLTVLATLANGSKIPLCEALSGPVIVRGRSPRNFQARKDVPLSGSAPSVRRSTASLTSATAPIRRSPTVDSLGSVPELKPSVSDSGYAVVHQGSVSPYMPPTPEPQRTRTTPLKRKSSGEHHHRPSLSLSVPQSISGFPQQRMSAALIQRPHKMSRSMTNASPHSSVSSSYVQTPLSLPSGSYAYSAHSLPGSTFFPTSMTKPTVTESGTLIGGYYQSPMDDWLPAGDGAYRPHVLQPSHLPAVTSVGGRGFYGDEAA